MVQKKKAKITVDNYASDGFNHYHSSLHDVLHTRQSTEVKR